MNIYIYLNSRFNNIGVSIGKADKRHNRIKKGNLYCYHKMVEDNNTEGVLFS